MSSLRLAVATVITVVGLVAAPAAAAQETDTNSSDRSAENKSVAINRADGTDIFRLAFAIDQIMNGTDDPENAAVAVASCEACRTTAIAIQFVMLTTPPTDAFTPANAAVAANAGCISCETVALAYQIVLQTDGPVKLTREGKRKIREILQSIRRLDDLDLTPAELDARVDALVDEMERVFNEELRPIGRQRNEDAESERGDQDKTDPTLPPDATMTPESTDDVADETAPPSAATTAPSPSSTPASSASPAPSTTSP